ncbi:MAG: pimeloyl-ACP methyl ester esterase BioH [Gammaproteobacteria bacterium]|nr:pimeloyl-ACP methyl ester esterase BioH [Gammaproteobacteria bacterium]MCW8958965.1 pimeloyl-ACP methyl ester esterase BioH [Gammaproteobacteria bacterium]MCW8972515.1 pimeloyl-ACP methyl ester esterase BioH [Gammaproteobacteria bacterium]MCW8993127.1 pimeloyl-ACP methyl ester esterase BioH [Gammaproteobacteria bacterium]
MTLYIETHGNGPDLVLLHGWGLHSGLFGPVIEPLAKRFRLHLVDLPGHGRSPMLEDEYTLENVAKAVADAVPNHALWLGWSLGGRITLAAAAAGAAVEKMILVGANPCFTQKPAWPHAMPEAELEQFAAALRNDYKATLQRFVALQSRGSASAREELRTLREELFAHGEPDPRALAGGLATLRDTDLRPTLAGIGQPTLLLHGERDTLTPLAAAEYTAAQLPNGKLEVIAGAGHAPFISHPDAFIRAVRRFLDA